MKILKPFLLPVLLAAQAAWAQPADLNGAWTIDASACNTMFTKVNDRLAFKPDADLNAGGLIVQGKQVTGTFQKCTVKSFLQEGSSAQVIASCSDGVAISDVRFELKMSGENRMTLSSKEPVPVEMPYFRCSM